MSPRQTSWQDYIENTLMSTTWITETGIYGLKDGQCWASTPNLYVHPLDVLDLSKLFIDSPPTADYIQIGDMRFTSVKHDTFIILAKSFNEGSCVLARAGSLLIIALCENNLLGNVYGLVSRLIEYLRDKGY